MDPNATVETIRQAIEDGDFDAADRAAADLRSWLFMDGRKPTVNGWPEIDWLLAARKFGIKNANDLFDSF